MTMAETVFGNFVDTETKKKEKMCSARHNRHNPPLQTTPPGDNSPRKPPPQKTTVRVQYIGKSYVFLNFFFCL